MIPFSDLEKIKYGDYIELKKAGDMAIARVIHVHEHKYYIERCQLTLVTVAPRLSDLGELVWTFELLRTYMSRHIDDPIEKKWIRLLYD